LVTKVSTTGEEISVEELVVSDILARQRKYPKKQPVVANKQPGNQGIPDLILKKKHRSQIRFRLD